jgi:hypothetical protein
MLDHGNAQYSYSLSFIFTFLHLFIGLVTSLSKESIPCAMNTLKSFLPVTILFLFLVHPHVGISQGRPVFKDSVVYRFIFRDTIVYRYDTVRIKHYVHSDTVGIVPFAPALANTAPKRKGWYNPNSWGIGPMVGAYYSPYHGFDLNVGFGVQYYLFAVPSFRNPHMGNRKGKK